MTLWFCTASASTSQELKKLIKYLLVRLRSQLGLSGLATLVYHVFLCDFVSLLSTPLPFLCFLVSLPWHSCHSSNFTVIRGVPVLTVIRVMPFMPCVLVIPGNFSMAGIPRTLPGIPVFLSFLAFLYSCHSLFRLATVRTQVTRQRRYRRYGKEPKDKVHRRNKKTWRPTDIYLELKLLQTLQCFLDNFCFWLLQSFLTFPRFGNSCENQKWLSTSKYHFGRKNSELNLILPVTCV